MLDNPHTENISQQDSQTKSESKNPSCTSTKYQKHVKYFFTSENDLNMVARIAKLNQLLPHGVKLVEQSELCKEEVSINTSIIPTHRQLVLKEKQLKRERDTQLERKGNPAREQKNETQYKRFKSFSGDFTSDSHKSSKICKDIKIPNPLVFQKCHCLLMRLQDHPFALDSMALEMENITERFELDQRFDSSA